jgi:hypothetical protein
VAAVMRDLYRFAPSLTLKLVELTLQFEAVV